MSRPTPMLYQAALRVLSYLYRHRHIGLRYEPSPKSLEGFSDSDWAVRHSTSGYVFNYCSAALSWGSKKQPTVALSSCEAEIVAASEATKEAIYLRNFLGELGCSSEGATALSVDNTAARDLAYNPEHHARVKHIERRHFFVRERVESLEITVPFVRSENNMADFFTKPLPASTFFRMRNVIMNVSASDASAMHEGVLRDISYRGPKASTQVVSDSAPVS